MYCRVLAFLFWIRILRIFFSKLLNIGAPRVGARTMRNVMRTSRGGGGVKGKGTTTVTFGNFFFSL